MNIRTPQPTQAARLLKAFFATQGVAVSHNQALEAVARLHGYQSWQALCADEDFSEPPALKPTTSRQYSLTEKTDAAWIKVDTINVSVTRTDEGVAVDLYKAGVENDCLASAQLLFAEVLTQEDLLDDELARKKDVLEELGVEFSTEHHGYPNLFSWTAPTYECPDTWPELSSAIEDAWTLSADSARVKEDMPEADWNELSFEQQCVLMAGLYDE